MSSKLTHQLHHHGNATKPEIVAPVEADIVAPVKADIVAPVKADIVAPTPAAENTSPVVEPKIGSENSIKNETVLEAKNTSLNNNVNDT